METIPASNAAPALKDGAFETLRNQLRGALLTPADKGYDGARSVWNGMVDKHPAGIARCRGVADVVGAVNFAREHDLPLAVRGGGHSVAGTSICNGGLVIDLSLMKAVRVDPVAKTARVAPGATWGDFDHEAQAFGLATTGGVDSRTGVAGLTLGGGLGYLARRCGLAIDNLLAADVVTADGTLVHASETKNPDLFWAVRGAGGSFGIVTSFQFQLHDVGPDVLTALLFHPISEGVDVLRGYRDVMAEAPDEFGCYGIVARVPPAPPFPEAYHGQPAVALIACYSGPIEEGMAQIAPLQELGNPIVNVVQPMSYAVLQKSFDDGYPDGARYYWKSQYLKKLPDDAIDTILHHAHRLPGSFTGMVLEPMGGAVNRIDTAAMAFPHRNAAFNFSIASGWSDPDKDDEIITWTKAFHEAMTPYATGGVYANYLDRDDRDRINAAFGDNFERLARLKTKWDPENLFRMNQEPTDR